MMGAPASASAAAPFGEPWRGRKELMNHAPQSVMPMSPGCAVVFGLPFLLPGLFIMAMAGGLVEVEPSSKNAPDWVIGMAGTIFALAGAGIVGSGLAGMRRQAAMEERARRHAGQRWRIDHHWDERHLADRAASGLGRSFGLAIFLSIFLGPFNWWAFLSDESEAFLVAIVSFFDLFLVGAIAYAIYSLIRKLRYGASRLVPRRWPATLGEVFEAELQVDAPVQGKELVLTLRYVEEAIETRGSGKNRSQQVVSYERYRSEARLPLAGATRTTRVSLAIPMPLEPDMENRLAASPASYWMLDVSAETPGVDYYAQFLLPAYSPGA
jgi:hypothetical protein